MLDLRVFSKENKTIEHKLGVIKTLPHKAKEVSTTTQGVKKEWERLKTAFRTCGYPDGAFSITSRKRDPKKAEDGNKHHSISIPNLARVSETFRRIIQKHNIPVQFKPSNTVRQRLVHPKTQTAISSVPYRARRNAMNCTLGKLNSPSLNSTGALQHSTLCSTNGMK